MTKMISVFALREHIASKFSAKEVDPFPSPHLVIGDFFPPEVFASILECNPFRVNAGKEWISQKSEKVRRQTTPYHHRKQIDLNEEFDMDPNGRAFWKVLTDALLKDDWFAKLIYSVYPAFFDLRFGEAMLDPGFFCRLRHMLFVQRHDIGYTIGPHTDSPHRVFTCIFSFADRPGFERYGTQFVRPRNRDSRCWGDLHHKPEDFEVAKVAGFSPNNFVIFFKTRQSFHSVATVDCELPNDRYGMQLGYYEPAGGLFTDLSRPDLMRDRTRKPDLVLTAMGRTIEITRNG